MVTKVSDNEFKNLLDTHSHIVVNYVAKWCGICRLFAPKFVRLSNRDCFKGILFLEVNTEDCPEARKFAGVNQLPFFAVIKSGTIIASQAASKEDAVEKLLHKLSE